MESRKYQLQTQIIEALKANDTDLYTLLRTQWAHRFGVESLDELKNLDLNESNQNPPNLDNQKSDKPQDSFIEVEKEISIKDDDNQGKEIKNEKKDLFKSVEIEKEISIKDDDNQGKEIKNEKKDLFKSVEIEHKESFAIKPNEKIDKENIQNKSINLIKEYKNSPKIEALIPLPPKPKYSYLNKWLLRS